MSDTPETDTVILADCGDSGFIRNLCELARKLERERDEARKKEECYIQEVESLRAEVEYLKADAELYAGWSKWKDGIWRISHPDSGPLAEWIAEDIEELKADKARLDWLEKRESMEGFTRDAIDFAMKGAE